MITLIVARARNGAIGRKGGIPWHLPEDLELFKRETLGGALIMGRKTWESLPVKPLPMRLNIVVSTNPEVAEIVAPSVSAAVNIAFARGYQRIYGIGGSRVYAELLPLAHRLLISDVDIEVHDADTFFPQIGMDTWDAISERPLLTAKPAFCVREYLTGR